MVTIIRICVPSWSGHTTPNIHHALQKARHVLSALLVCRVLNKLWWYLNGYINPINNTHTSFFQSLSLLGVMQSRLAMCVSLCIILIPFSVSPCVPDSWRSDGTTKGQRKHLGYLLRKRQPPMAMNQRWEPQGKRTLAGRPNKTWQRVALSQIKTAGINGWYEKLVAELPKDGESLRFAVLAYTCHESLNKLCQVSQVFGHMKPTILPLPRSVTVSVIDVEV